MPFNNEIVKQGRANNLDILLHQREFCYFFGKQYGAAGSHDSLSEFMMGNSFILGKNLSDDKPFEGLKCYLLKWNKIKPYSTHFNR